MDNYIYKRLYVKIFYYKEIIMFTWDTLYDLAQVCILYKTGKFEIEGHWPPFWPPWTQKIREHN